MAGSHYGTTPSPANLRAIWDQIIRMRTDLTAAQATIQQQQATIDSQAAQLSQQSQQTQQALILAGKAASQTSTGVAPAPGGGSGGANGESHPNYQQQVIDAKAELVALGEDLSGSCGAFKITRKVAQMITPSDPAVGLLDKPTGNNCMGYAVDIIAFNDGLIYDILGDSGGANDPQWNFLGQVDPSRYRPSF